MGARFEDRGADWIGVDEAVRRVLAAAGPLPEEEAPLEESVGRALARDLVAHATLPPFDNSAMDGYAVVGADVAGAREERAVVLTVVGETRAGDPSGPLLESGCAVRIMTGAPLPPGADTVIRVEHTDGEKEEGRVRIHSDADRDRHIRPAGQDMTAGETVLVKGTAVTPGVVAVAAALGYDRIPVRCRPRVAILSSGDELRTPADYDDVRDGRGIPDSNAPALAAAVREAGGDPVRLGIARDDPDHIRDRVRAATGCDLLLTIGGASMGEADLFKRVLEELGLRVLFWRVRIRPGSPFSQAELPEAGPSGAPLPVLGLPGNPASAFVTFQILARPLVLALAGHRRVHRRVVRAVAGERLASTARLTHFHRVTLEGEQRGLLARLTGPQGSGLVKGLGTADGLAVVPEGREAVEAGEDVEVILLDDGPAAASAPGYSAGVTDPGDLGGGGPMVDTHPGR